MSREDRLEKARANSDHAEEVRKAVKDLGESNSGNRDQRMHKLVELTGSQSRAARAYEDYTGVSGGIRKLFGR